MTPILMYHSISPNFRGFRSFTVSPARFEQHARYLSGEGYQALTVSELVRLRASGRDAGKSVVLTFDDGFADFHQYALPILTRYRLTATLYVVSGAIGGDSRWLADARSRPLLSWSQLAEIRNSGIEIGAHSVSHPALDTLPIGQAREEIEASMRLLETGLGMDIRSFAYPYGYYSPAVRDLVAAAGYSSACAVHYAISDVADDPFALSRLGVRHDTDTKGLAGLLTGKTPRLRHIYDRTRSNTWACLRQALYRHRVLAEARDG